MSDEGFGSFLFFTSTAARKRLVAPIPWGGEEEAQEEASRSESQLLLYGCEMSRYSNAMNTFVAWKNDARRDARVVTCVLCPFSFLLFFQAATRSQQCSATLRQWCCVSAVQQSCVSPLEAKHVSQRVSPKPATEQLPSYTAGFFSWHLEFSQDRLCPSSPTARDAACL